MHRMEYDAHEFGHIELSMAIMYSVGHNVLNTVHFKD